MRRAPKHAPIVVTLTAVVTLILSSGAAWAQVPDFLQVGSRLTWEGGNSIVSGSRLVPDPDGPLIRDGQRFRLDGTRGGGGTGLTQLNIVSAGPQGIVADLRYLLAGGPQLNVYSPSGFDVVVSDAQGLGDYWLPPTRLAAMQTGVNGNMKVWRDTSLFGNQTLSVVNIVTSGPGAYYTATYDAASGLMLFSGTMTAQDGTQVADAQGVLTNFAGSVSYSHQLFKGVRQVVVPWAAEGIPQWATPGRTTTYQGQTSLKNDPAMGLPNLPGQPFTTTLVFDRVAGTASIGRQITQSYSGEGMPPMEATANRAFGSAQLDGLWASPQVLAQLQPQQVLDQDPYSGQVVYFGGVNGNYGLIITQGQTNWLELYYDMQTGILVFTRNTVPGQGVGTQVTELQLTSQQ